MSGYVDDDRNPNFSQRDWKEVLEWDKPMIGLYSDGAIRVITTRHRGNNAIGACHAAKEEDLKRLEHVHGVKFSSDEWAQALKWS